MKEGLQIVSGIIDLVAAATNRSKAEVTEEFIAELRNLLDNPPKPMEVDADAMREAFERARRERGTDSEDE